MNNSLVSILIPVFNREKLITETVTSALNQTYDDFEIIIVDNKSTDDTWNIISQLSNRDKRIKIFQNKTNIGPVRNWKRCIDEASGVFGKILWSDDLITPTFLEKTVPYLKNNQDIGFVFTGTEIFFDGTNQKSDHYFIAQTGVYDIGKYINGVLFEDNYPVSPGCALFRLKDLKSNLLIDIPNKVHSDFSMHAIGNDLLIFLLTTKKYQKFAFINELHSFFREHKNSISIQSDYAKVLLYYNLAATYYIEHFQPNLIRKMNTNIWFILTRHKTDAHKYNFDKIEDFYMDNKDFEIDFVYLLHKVYKILLRKVQI